MPQSLKCILLLKISVIFLKKNLKGIICLNIWDWHFNDMWNGRPKLHIQPFHLLRSLQQYLLFTPKGRKSHCKIFRILTWTSECKHVKGFLSEFDLQIINIHQPHGSRVDESSWSRKNLGLLVNGWLKLKAFEISVQTHLYCPLLHVINSG